LDKIVVIVPSVHPAPVRVRVPARVGRRRARYARVIQRPRDPRHRMARQPPREDPPDDMRGFRVRSVAGVRGIAVPVGDDPGLGCLSVSGPSSRFDEAAAAEALPHVRDIASALLSMRSPALHASSASTSSSSLRG
jgi:hypothetical protein